MGLVISTSRAQNIAICSQPLKVMGGPSWECPPSETFWADQGVDEIDKQADRDDRTQYIVEDHDGGSSQTIAGERVEHERSEKQAADHKIGDVEHGRTPGDSNRPWAVDGSGRQPKPFRRTCHGLQCR